MAGRALQGDDGGGAVGAVLRGEEPLVAQAEELGVVLYGLHVIRLEHEELRAWAGRVRILALHERPPLRAHVGGGEGEEVRR